MTHLMPTTEEPPGVAGSVAVAGALPTPVRATAHMRSHCPKHPSPEEGLEVPAQKPLPFLPLVGSPYMHKEEGEEHHDSAVPSETKPPCPLAPPARRPVPLPFRILRCPSPPVGLMP